MLSGELPEWISGWILIQNIIFYKNYNKMFDFEWMKKNRLESVKNSVFIGFVRVCKLAFYLCSLYVENYY